MTTTTPAHPVLVCVDAIAALLKDVTDVDPVFMRTEDKTAALVGLSTVLNRAEELRLRLLVSADDVAEQSADRDAAAWLARTTLVGRSDARRLQRLGRALDQRWTHVQRALRQGEVNLDQAEAVVASLDALPAEVDAEVLSRAETELVAQAALFGPKELRVLGRRVLHVVAPEVADESERRALEREEAHASSLTRVTSRSRGDGVIDIFLRVSDGVARRFFTYLEPYASPRRPDGTEAVNPDDRRPYPQRLGHAFAAFLEDVDPKRLPLHGGNATTVVVTIDHETLLEQLGDAGVAWIGDEPISASEARRLACNANLLPVVLGGDSVPLDQARLTRLYKGTRRDTLAATQPTCRADGCDIPAAWCDAHHGNGRWADGAGTNLADAILLCPFHHHRAHDRRYDLTRLPNGRVRFNRRT
ncbi:MAG TPA: DUF222 domain-containing protein [Nocardioides sp.]|uniref:DUF222 domain-containing protein n=1 Tax=Nocardioides sp. TaxID=35761 RepID=UPI002E2EBFA4|nr:DUF222 domain-containing protein [Nocardioides sp.]HEX5089107.1 DUF222 domain-containing protein [Nocardioides sp.]